MKSMVRILAIAMVFVLALCSTALAAPRTIDLETMSVDELTALKNEVSAAIVNASVENVDGYNVLTEYSEYARNPDGHVGEKVRFNGEVVQVVEGIEYNVYRIAMNGNSDNMFYVEYAPTIESGRVLEGDKITLFGDFMGLYTYSSTLGGEITIPYCVAESIVEEIKDEGEYAATRQDPAPIGATIRYNGESYSNPAVTDLTVTKVIRGDSAWQMVKGFNR